MVEEIKNSLSIELQSTKCSIQLDKATLGRLSVKITLIPYYSDRKELIAEEFLTADQLKKILFCIKNIFGKYKIPISNVISVASNKAPSMVGKYRRILFFLF